MRDFEALRKHADSLLDPVARGWFVETIEEIGDPERPAWGTWDTWLADLADATSVGDAARVNLLVRQGYLRVRFYLANGDEPPLASDEDLEVFVVLSPDELRERLESS